MAKSYLTVDTVIITVGDILFGTNIQNTATFWQGELFYFHCIKYHNSLGRPSHTEPNSTEKAKVWWPRNPSHFTTDCFKGCRLSCTEISQLHVKRLEVCVPPKGLKSTFCL